MMEFIKQPMAIERRSMELIAPYIEGLSLSEAEKKAGAAQMRLLAKREAAKSNSQAK